MIMIVTKKRVAKTVKEVSGRKVKYEEKKKDKSFAKFKSAIMIVGQRFRSRRGRKRAEERKGGR